MKPYSTFDANPLDSWSDTWLIRGNLELEERILVELTNTGEIKFNIGNIYVAATPIFHQLPFFEQQTFAQWPLHKQSLHWQKSWKYILKNYFLSNKRQYNQIKFILLSEFFLLSDHSINLTMLNLITINYLSTLLHF